MILDQIRQLPFEEIRDMYTEYLKTQNLSPLTVQTSRSDAFYLLRYDKSLDFWEMIQSDDFEEIAFNRLQTVLRERSKGNTLANIGSYMAHLRRFRRFLYSDSKPSQPISEAKPRKERVSRKKGYPEVPSPTPQDVIDYQLSWDAKDTYREQERALNRLFFTLAPGNKDLADILLKVTTLNQFYSTNIFSIYPVAEHIQSLQIDNRLASGDCTLVDDIQVVHLKESTKHFYSFASKYCSHHNPEAFPIYDSYVDEVLRYFRDVDGFATFRASELKNYSRFKEILIKFQSFYGLEQFTLKEIDKYIWQLAKKYFPKTYNKSKS